MAISEHIRLKEKHEGLIKRTNVEYMSIVADIGGQTD